MTKKIIAVSLLASFSLLANIHPNKNQKILFGSGVVFGALAHKQVGKVLKTAASSVVHPVAAVKKVRDRTK